MLIPVAIVSLVILLYLYMVWNNDYWKKRNVPYEKPLPIFGNMIDIFTGTKHYGLLSANIYNKFQNVAYAGYFNMRKPGIVVRDPMLIKNILVKDFNHFAYFDFHIDTNVDKIWGENLIAQRGDIWKRNRSAWGLAMTGSKIKSMYDNISENCNVMIDHLKNYLENHPDEPIEIRDMSMNFFTDNIVNNILGLKINSFVDKENTFKVIVHKMFNWTSAWDNALLFLAMVCPTWLRKSLKLTFITKPVEKELIKMANDVLHNRETTGFKNTTFETVFNTQHGNNKSIEHKVGGLIFSLLVDGTETSSGVAGFIFYSLADNPEVQRRLREEIYSVANGERLSNDEINSLQYLDMVISESLRLYPSLLTLERTCTEPYELPPIYPGSKPVRLEEGTGVTIPIYALHTDPKYFPDPFKFDPERFNEENKRSRDKFTYLPFGEGPRICIGTRFALNQIKIGVVEILRHFEIRLAPNMMGNPISMDPKAIIYKNAEGLWVTLHKIDDF